jgi:hypothetical protein
VADLIDAGAFGISAGTNNHAVGEALAGRDDVMVVTHSLPVAEVLHATRGTNGTVILTGGMRTPSDALVGPVTVAALRDLHVDTAILGVHGMDPRAGDVILGLRVFVGGLPIPGRIVPKGLEGMREIGWWSSGRQAGFELQEIHPCALLNLSTCGLSHLR